MGIEALDYGENHDAERFYEAAKGQYILALEARMRPSDWANLGKMAGKRGRPRKIEKSVAPARKRGRPKKINR
ncbi:MAG: hypothetical protein C3F11_14025 [Methylocystaceae bacterium]|nr:MAG: hypothetical protein C3F11_14025 [Methylocystaceae bacterium]